jgi:hypothetical protein
MSATGPSISKVELERFKCTAVKYIDPRRLPKFAVEPLPSGLGISGDNSGTKCHVGSSMY